ncbi:MAG: sugar ABC transporter ATP-binding protein [Bifidobacteriaceae bacterium]|jgi:ribose transport system ATP-binding protein|nr:sugar ABC transporter ATP-binding protein [Bifidobacteriaceae bacterium]
MTPPLMQVSGLSKSFPGVLALDDVTLEIQPGEVHALVGENGAGKSTLIKILAGAYRADRGRILWEGTEVQLKDAAAATRLGISVIHQDLNLVPNLSVAENVLLGRPAPKRLGLFVNWGELSRRARRAIERLDAEFDPQTPLRELSHAMRVLVAIARALTTDARLIIMDEPTAALSAAEADRLHEIVRDLSGSGTAVLYVSHRLDEVLALANTITVFKDGRHVGTVPRSAVTDKRELTQMIIGRRLNEATERSQTRAPGEVLVEVRNVSLGQRLKGASLTVRANEVVGLAGLVGSGRSELGRVIFGAERPAAGSIIINDRPVRKNSPRLAMSRGVAMLPEDRRNQASIATMSIRQNTTLVSMGKYLWGPFFSSRRERKAVKGLIERFQIKVVSMARPIRQLSGGNQQKVIVARWVNRSPSVLIFDEPTQGVDVGAKQEILGIVSALADDGAGVVFISSELDEVLQVSDRIVVLREGEVAAELKGPDVTRDQVLHACYGTDELT